MTNELAVRPAEGVGFTPGRAAVINTSGQIDGAAGNLSDCVRVDGTSGPCGTGGSGSGVLPSFADGEIPGGAANGSNTAFTLAFAPSPAGSLLLYRNGLLMKQGTDYVLTGNAVTFFAAATPQSGDSLVASYRYANPANPLGTLTAAQVICGSVGTSTAAAALTQLGSCTIPAGLLGAGDRVEVQFQYAHSGSAAGFTADIEWGGIAVLTRTAAAGETAIAGRLEFGIYPGGQAWNAESSGNTLSFATAAGNATADTTQNLTIALRGEMSAAGSDSVILRNFTVVRYPAQTNP